MRDWDKTVISQFASSPVLLKLLDSINDCLDPRASLETFYDQIWDIEHAGSYGLDVWGRIVGVGRVLQVSSGVYFGFAEATGSVGFGQAPFYTGQPTTTNYRLSIQAYRQLIFAKAAANITDGSIKAINAILMNLFPGRGNAYVTDGAFSGTIPHFGFFEAGDARGFNQAPFGEAMPSHPAGMVMTYVFNFILQPFEQAIVLNSGVLPKPTGVLASASFLS